MCKEFKVQMTLLNNAHICFVAHWQFSYRSIHKQICFVCLSSATESDSLPFTNNALAFKNWALTPGNAQHSLLVYKQRNGCPHKKENDWSVCGDKMAISKELPIIICREQMLYVHTYRWVAIWRLWIPAISDAWTHRLQCAIAAEYPRPAVSTAVWMIRPATTRICCLNTAIEQSASKQHNRILCYQLY